MKKFIINYHFKDSGLGELTEEREFNTFLEAMEYIDDRYKIFYFCHKECEFTMVGKDFSIGIVEKQQIKKIIAGGKNKIGRAHV